MCGDCLRANTEPIGRTEEFDRFDRFDRSPGTIIPLASGRPIVLTTTACGDTCTSAVVDFGNSASGLDIKGREINLNRLPVYYAFTSPVCGKIREVSAFFKTNTCCAMPGTEFSIYVSLYCCKQGCQTFRRMLKRELSPDLRCSSNSCRTCNGNFDECIDVDLGDQILTVFSAKSCGNSLVNTITGFASGGIKIV